MSREILEAMHALAREKGIEPEKLMIALEDALLSAYKKQPGSAKYARVEMDRETADFRVIELIIPERLEAHLIVETIDEGTVVDPETGELREPEDPEIDPAKFAQYRDQIDERDVTPDDFGRIAAQTAKQVILQRIREAERDMMFEEYRDRVGELITGIVQQSDSRYTLVQLRERVEALAAQVRAGRRGALRPLAAHQGGHQGGVALHEGPLDHRLEARSRADQEAVRARGARDRRRTRRDRQRGAGAGLPLEDRGRLARRRRRPGRRVRRAARVARTHGRLRAARREDRHHPVQRRARPLRGQGAVAGPRARSARRRRRQAGDRDRARRSALARDRTRGPERASRGAAHRLARRHPLGDRVRGRGGRARLRGGGGPGPLRGDPLQRPSLPQRGAAGFALLRPRRPPGARPRRGRPRRRRRARRGRRGRRRGRGRARRAHARAGERGAGRRSPGPGGRRCRPLHSTGEADAPPVDPPASEASVSPAHSEPGSESNGVADEAPDASVATEPTS